MPKTVSMTSTCSARLPATLTWASATRFVCTITHRMCLQTTHMPAVPAQACFLGWVAAASLDGLPSAPRVRKRAAAPRAARYSSSWRTFPQRPQRGRETMEDVPAAAAPCVTCVTYGNAERAYGNARYPGRCTKNALKCR